MQFGRIHPTTQHSTTDRKFVRKDVGLRAQRGTLHFGFQTRHLKGGNFMQFGRNHCQRVISFEFWPPPTSSWHGSNPSNTSSADLN